MKRKAPSEAVLEYGNHDMTKEITLDAAITEIAQLVFSDETMRDAKKRVRNAFEHAARTNNIALAGENAKGEPTVFKREFECWAAGIYPLLQAKYQVPIVGSLGGTLPPLTASLVGLELPMEHDDPVERFIAVSIELIRTRGELAEIEEKRELLEQQIAYGKAKKAASAKKRSESGKPIKLENWLDGPAKIRDTGD